MNEELIIKFIPALRGLRAYHKHEVQGMKHIPQKGSVIIASTHSLATYDLLLLMTAIFEEYGRFPRSLIDHLFYKVPGIGNLMEALGCVAGNQINGKSLLSNGEILCLAPGGMKESLRSSQNKYKIYWHDRRGFAKLSIESGVPIILAACPRADDVYDVYENRLSTWLYQKFKTPFFMAKGLGLTMIPKPIKLIHHISEAIYPPHFKGRNTPEELVNHFHSYLSNRMEALIRKALRDQDNFLLT